MLALDMTSNPNKEYDYITINTFSDPAYMDNPYSKATMEKVMGADYQTKMSDLYKRMSEIKEVAKFEIWEQKAYAGPASALSPDKAPLWVINGIKVKNGQEAEYASRVNKVTPMYQDLVNQGKEFAWISSALAYPSADESPYNFSSMILLPDMKSLLDEPNMEDAFKKAMPGVDRKQYLRELDEIRKFSRQEVYYLVEYAVKGATTAQASK
ncbi:hypothetical protein [Spirosoma rhododendri]|uniref:Uncharacterized protein n=1 Tax=Spirosoma rhododendri TaxID=2728024 RepID=A0A7L5DQC8_9BACT|nr:hypothetical protein [Spirosoma rhododendri]QJD80629.1 hypothetical protein HH216_21075 [Spirosoma rhododendri]